MRNSRLDGRTGPQDGSCLRSADGSQFASLQIWVCRRENFRTFFSEPMLREGTYRNHRLMAATSEPVVDRQMAFVKTFADQAVIAVETYGFSRTSKESA